jgi:hypothetical protein
MSDDPKKDEWTTYRDDGKGYNAEKDIRFYGPNFLNTDVRFSIKPDKHAGTILSIAGIPYPGEKIERHSYVVKEGADYAKKIVWSITKLFEGCAADLYGIDMCLKKSFSLGETRKNLKPRGF